MGARVVCSTFVEAGRILHADVAEVGCLGTSPLVHTFFFNFCRGCIHSNKINLSTPALVLQ